MKEYLRLALALVVVVAGLASLGVVLTWAPRWVWEIVVGVGLASFLGDLWRRRVRASPILANENLRIAVAVALVLGCAVLVGLTTGAWAGGALVAAVGVSGIWRRLQGTV